MAKEDQLSYRRGDTRARTGGGGIKVAGEDERMQQGQENATKFQQAVEAGYDPVSYGYNPNTGQKVGETNARRQVAEAEAAKQKAKIEQEEATKRAMMNAGLTEDGKTRAPMGGQAASRTAAPAPRKSFTVGEDGKPEWTGGYIDGRIGGEVMREERAKAEEAFKQGKGPQPFGPSKSDREYDAYLEAMNKYNASQKPTAPADPTTDLDGVDDSATPKPPTPPATPTTTVAPTTDTAPVGDGMASGATAAVEPAVRSPEGDAARFFNTVAKGVSAGGKAGSFSLVRPTYNAPQTGLAGAANKYLTGQAKAGQFLQANLDDAVKHTAGLMEQADLAKPSVAKITSTLATEGAGGGNLLRALDANNAAAQLDELVKSGVMTEAAAAKELAKFTAQTQSVAGKALSKTANVVSKVANSKIAKGAGKGATVLGAGMDIVDSIGAVGSVYSDDYDSNNAEAAAYREKVAKFGEAGTLGKAGMIAKETYNLTPAVLGGGGNTVSGVKAMIDTQTNLMEETIGGEGDVALGKMRSAMYERDRAKREPYLAPLLPAADPNLPENERRAAQQRAFAKLPKEERSRILDQAEVNMTVDKMLTKDPTLKQFIESDPERGAEMMNELRTQATEQRRLFKEKQKNTGRP